MKSTKTTKTNSNNNTTRGRRNPNKSKINTRSKANSDFSKDDDGIGDPRSMKRSSGSNDVSWYAHNPEMLKSSASIPFTDVTGIPFNFNNSQSVPGIMRIRWSPNFGTVDGPMNQAANLIYSNTVHANSRNKSYDAPDEMLLILAGAQVFSALSMGLRAYGTMRRYNQLDRYTPEGIITAMGFDYQDLKANLANMWFGLNELILKATQIWIPNVMPLTERWYWMNANIYKDGASIKSQYYMFVQETFYKYDETTSTNGGSLRPVAWLEEDSSQAGADKPDKLRTWSFYLNFVNSLIDALINSQDRGIIFGDILKAYGPESLYRMAAVTSDYTIEPVYDREVLSQIENATFYWSSHIRDVAVLGPVYQDHSGAAPTLKFAYQIVQSNFQGNEPGAKQLYMNFHQLEAPTPDQIMVASRLMTSGIIEVDSNPDGISGQGFSPLIAGSEIPIGCDVYYYSISEGNYKLNKASINVEELVDDKGKILPATQMSDLQWFLWTAFDWAPGIAVQKSLTYKAPISSPQVPELVYKILDYDNYTSLDAGSDLRKMHNTAMYSLFGVPVMSTI